MDVAGLVLLDSSGASVDMKWASAVSTLLRKVTGLGISIRLELLIQIRG